MSEIDPKTEVAPHEARRFKSTVAYYQRHRLAYPDRLIARVAALAGLRPGNSVLDLGAGTGMLAVGFAKAGMTVTAMDPEPDMLAVCQEAAQAAGVTVALRQGGSADLTPDMGPFRLVTMGRSFHWMDRAATLAMLEQIVTPDGGVALFHDAHPPVPDNGWFKVMCDVQDRFGRGTERHIRERRGGHSRYEPFLLASQFTQLDGLSVTVRHAVTVDELVGRAFSMSTCSREKLGNRAEEFAAALSAALRELSPGGTFTEIAEMVAVLARRPGQDA
ncbi:MAG TPA: methyltransferase domain-containing protein [Rhizomicrobium sp.]|nr:methyltransferase domain-containing protein [Rhizomicrobium sp.]